MSKGCDYAKLPKPMNEIERERAIRANKIYCQACEEHGIKVCSWENFSAWQEYVDGKIPESQLAERAKDEVRQFTDTFKKYTIIEKEEAQPADSEAEKAERMKLANKIYRKTCTDSGLSFCFFKNFSTWSDYVQGKVDDTEFYEKAKSEVTQMLKDAAEGKPQAPGTSLEN